MIREPVVAGQFYPSGPKELEKIIISLKSKEEPKLQALGIILPHAGYIYSGKVAVATISKIIPKKRIIILGPNHTGAGEDFGIFSEGKWNMPFKDIEIDQDLASRILERSNFIKKDYLAHKHEHSIEVELPILQYFFGEFKFVPIVCALSSISTYKKVAEEIHLAIEDIKDQVLLIASSDMSHYEEDSVARKKDRFAIESILNLDEEELLRRINKENISMCGVAPVSILIACCKRLKAKKAQVILYQTSGDSSGDYSSVVGYLGAVIN